jgi:hypothetical protein
MSFDVLKETDAGSHRVDTVADVGPKVPRVLVSEALSRGTKRLAWIAARKQVHESSKFCVWEGFKIRPDRCRVQQARFHLCDQVRTGEGFDLTKSDCAQIWDCSFESEVNAAISGTKGDV